jgi:oligopeptide/dipeptide ABC transporter ATP-binding protein
MVHLLNIIEVKNVKKYFPIKGGLLSKHVGEVKAVDDISFNIKKGETMGLVGESGCGKTTVGRCILGTLNVTSGSIEFLGDDITDSNKLKLHRKDIQMIFQDPYSSLNPRFTIADIIWEPVKINKKNIEYSGSKEETVIELLKDVGMSYYHIYRYPHEISGGQKQRVALARAIATHPKFVICDEPVASLDVSVRAQIINLMKELQKNYDLTYLFISHDLSVVNYISDTIAVMYLGSIIEKANTGDLFNHPAHPYTQALISAIPNPDPTLKKERIILKGEVQTPIDPPSGCKFHTRCWKARTVCSAETPKLTEINKNHFVACHFYDK